MPADRRPPVARHPRRLVLALAAATTALSAAADADAYCRTTTVQPPASHGSVDGSSESGSACWTEGLPLYHPSQCLPYRLLAKESPVIPNAVLSDRLARAFSSWTAPSSLCTPGITAIELAPVADTEIVHYGSGEANRNVVGVVPVWNHAGAGDTLALATVTFGADTGAILDVDLEINGTVPWSFEAPSPGEFDLEAILTHEAGHMFGLAHSPVPEATMYAAYTPGSIEQRTLAEDDQEAICAVYPSRTERLATNGLVPSTACNLAPGSAGACGEPVLTHGCAMVSAAPSHTSRDVLGLALLSTLAAIFVRRRSSGSISPKG